MCLAAYKPKGVEIEKKYLRSGFYSNCSGCGFMYHDNGKLFVVKGLFSFNEFYEKVQAVGQKEHDMAFHFRAASHGPVSDANCHPYEMVDGKWAMLHNGIFSIRCKNPNLSDSGNYAHDVLEPAILNGTYKDKFSDGTFKLQRDNRWGWGAVVLMSAGGEVTIYNEDMGEWDNDIGAWFSNGAYRLCDYAGNSRYMDERDEENYRCKPRPGYGCFAEGEWGE